MSSPLGDDRQWGGQLKPRHRLPIVKLVMDSSGPASRGRHLLLVIALIASNLAFGAAAYVYGRFESQPVLPAALAACGLIAGTLAMGLARGRMRSSAAILVRVDAAQHGDLDMVLGEDSLGSGVVARRTSALLAQLRTTVMDVQLGSQDLYGAGEAILEAIGRQARGAAEQSAAASQTSAAVEEMHASTQEAAKLAEAVAATAPRGGPHRVRGGRGDRCGLGRHGGGPPERGFDRQQYPRARSADSAH